jgi:F-type H+-transporting ATPase subunit delta
MGSATRDALASAIATLDSVKGSDDLTTGEQLLEVGRIIGNSSQLRVALADHSADGPDKLGIIGALFGSYTEQTRAILGTAVQGRWSSEEDLLAGIEELGIRAIAVSAGEHISIESELFSFETAVRSDSALEFAVGSKLGSVESKVSLVDTLLRGKASAETIAIVRHLVQQPRGRRIGELLRFATSVVADQSGLAVATVSTAQALTPEQLERLTQGLAGQYGRGLRVNQVIEPALIGGVRVQIGDDVIDGSVATKLNDLRLQLAR